MQSAWCSAAYNYPLDKAAFLQLHVEGRPTVRVGSLCGTRPRTLSQQRIAPAQLSVRWWESQGFPLWESQGFPLLVFMSLLIDPGLVAFLIFPIKTIFYYLPGEVKFSSKPGTGQRWTPRRIHVYSSSLQLYTSCPSRRGSILKLCWERCNHLHFLCFSVSRPLSFSLC